MSYREKKSRKKFMGGFYGGLVARKSAASPTRPTRKSRISATKIKNLRKTEHMSKIMVCWGCLPIFWRSNHIWRQEPQKTKKGHFRQWVGRLSICLWHFALFWDQILSQITSYAWILKIKDQFKVSCKKTSPKSHSGEKNGGLVNLPPPPGLIRLAESPAF